MTRRDKLRLAGLRAARLNDVERARAWAILAAYLEQLGDRDLPKFADVYQGIRSATIGARQMSKPTCPYDDPL